MSELHAAAGMTSLASMSETIRANSRCFETYRSLLRLVPGAELLDVAQKGRSNYQYVVVELPLPQLWIGRDQLVRILQAEGVLARRYFFPGCHRCLPYLASARTALPVTEEISERVIVLPTGPSVDDTTIGIIVDLMRFVVEHSDEIEKAMEKRSSHYRIPERSTRAG